MNQTITTPVSEPDSLDNEDLEELIASLEKDRSPEQIEKLKQMLAEKIRNRSMIFVPVADYEDEIDPGADLFRMDKISLDEIFVRHPKPRQAKPRKVELAAGGEAFPAFTSRKEIDKGAPSKYTAITFKEFLELASQEEDCQGIVLNPWDVSVLLDQNMIASLLDIRQSDSSSSHLYLVRWPLEQSETDVQACFCTPEFEPTDEESRKLLEMAALQIRTSFTDRAELNPGSAVLFPDVLDQGKALLVLIAPIHIGCDRQENIISDCYRNGLNEVMKAGYHSAVFPVITKEQYGELALQCETATILTVSAWIAEHPEESASIYLNCPDDETYREYLYLLMGEDAVQKGSA